jgi:hypothetical protein
MEPVQPEAARHGDEGEESHEQRLAEGMRAAPLSVLTPAAPTARIAVYFVYQLGRQRGESSEAQ